MVFRRSARRRLGIPVARRDGKTRGRSHLTGVWFSRGWYRLRGVLPADGTRARMHELQDIRIHRGDALQVEIKVMDDGDPPRAIDLAYSVAVFSVRHGDGLTGNYGAPILPSGASVITRSSYGGADEMGGIEWTDPRNGVLSVVFREEDTRSIPSVPLYWSLRVWRPVSEEPLLQDGTVTVLAGDNTVFGTGTKFTDALGMGWNTMGVVKQAASWIMLLPAPGTDSKGGPVGPTYPVVVQQIESDSLLRLRDRLASPPMDGRLDRVAYKVLPAVSSIVASGRFLVEASTVR